MNQVMLDLETLDTKVTAVIVSIGAVRFGPDGVHWDWFYRTVKWEAGPRTVSRETCGWWLQQSPEAQSALYCPNAEHLAQVLVDFAVWLGPDAVVWANSPDFDCSIVKHAYEQFGTDAPWAYNATRCYRTLRKLNPAVPPPPNACAHNALEDAKVQALHAAAMLYGFAKD